MYNYTLMATPFPPNPPPPHTPIKRVHQPCSAIYTHPPPLPCKRKTIVIAGSTKGVGGGGDYHIIDLRR